MPTLTLTTTFADNNPLSIAGYNANTWVPATPNTSLEVINGGLDADNMDASWTTVKKEQVQPYQLCGGTFAAGTANLDYFSDWFEGVSYADASLRQNRMVPIPGGGKPFYLGQSCWVMLCWTIMWTNDNTNRAFNSEIYLQINGSVSSVDGRTCRKTATANGPNSDWANTTQSIRKLTWWSGHKLVFLTQGWHTANLCMYADEGISQTRVWARSMRVIHF